MENEKAFPPSLPDYIVIGYFKMDLMFVVYIGSAANFPYFQVHRGINMPLILPMTNIVIVL